ncbi:hypothetical protein POF50_019690 [Streptomyces sp. SL13]|uniref:DUF4760 domain-containing protein n=1 Tax=Streptantibioticus silvisoli TaxID=2705255 RepID=A0AA90H9S4_9ACTN|nr:hypothetical protein [Streptantibioticus silvisoli]MDI5971525.1 hypothetical protein [Streptantibioticus silvisoli]
MELADFAEQSGTVLIGAVVGGLIAAWVARWQTEAGARYARDVATSERSAQAALQLVERLADLRAWLPSLPDVGENRPAMSLHARKQCSIAMESVRRGGSTELLAITNGEVRARFRILIRMIYDVGWRYSGRGHRERQIRDVGTYLAFVRHSLEALIDGKPLPPPLTAPDLDRPEGAVWPPMPVPEAWSDPADGFLGADDSP